MLREKRIRTLSIFMSVLIATGGLLTILNSFASVRGNPITPNDPTSGDTLTGEVEFSCDSASATKVELRIDGVLVGTMSENAGTWTYTINTSGWADGSHIVRYDSIGDNSDNVVSIPVKFDNNGPRIVEGSTLYPEGQINAKPGDRIAVSAKVTDPVSAISWVGCDASLVGGGSNETMYDDGLHNDAAPNDNVWGTSPINVTSRGGYSAVYVLAGDTEGNLRNVTVSANVDMYEPTILEIQTMLPAGQEAVKNGDDIRLTAKALDYKLVIETVVERKPLDVVLALDNSGSMAANNGSGGMMWDDLEYAATTFIDRLAENDRAAVFGFDYQAGWPFEDVKLYSPFLLMSDTYTDPQGTAYTSTGRNVSNYVITRDDGLHLTNGAGRPNCNTPIWDTVGMAMQYAVNNRRTDAVPVVVAMTDGVDTVGATGYETGSETYCPGARDGAIGQTWTVNGGCIWNSPMRTYTSVQREQDANPNNPLTTINFNPWQDERTRTGLLNASIPVFTIGLGITPQGSNATAPGYLDPSATSYKYTTEFDLSNIANTSVGGDYYYAPESTDLYEIYTEVSQVIQSFGTDVLGKEQPKGVGSVQGDLSSVGIPLKVNMFDDGLHADGKSGDNVFGSELVTVNSLETGSIIFQVEGTDEAGNENRTQFSLQLDNVQPTVAWVNTTYPPGREKAQDQYSIYVESNCSDAQTGLGKVYLDATNIGGGDKVPMEDDGTGNDRVAYDGVYTSQNVTITTGLVSGTYTYTVNAYDKAGNPGSQSGNIEIRNDVDIILTNLVKGDVISGLFPLRANITDPDGIPDNADNPKYRIDANPWLDMSSVSGSVFEGVINTSDHPDGEHTLYVYAEDVHGARSTLETSVIFDNTPPGECSVTAPVNDEFVGDVYSFKLTAADAIGMNSVNVTIFNETGAEVLSNASVGYNSDSGYYELSYNTANLIDGTYGLKGYATDGTDHTTASGKTTFFIDNNGPDMNIIYPQEGMILSGLVRFNVTVNETFLTELEYKIDNSGWIDSSKEWRTWLYSDGEHDIRVRALDGGGRKVEENYIVTVDNNHPACSLSLPTHRQFISDIYTFGALVSDKVGLDKVWIRVGENTTNATILNASMSYNANTGYYETFFDTSGVPDGNYSARVFATDTAGNLTPSRNVSFMVDNNAPGLTIDHPEDGDVIWGVVALDIGITGEPFLDRLQYNVDSGGWVNASVPWNTTESSEGEHNMDIRATDLSGHKTTGSITVIVDNNSPFGDIVSPNDNEYISGRYTFRVGGGDDVGVKKVVFNVFSGTYNATYNALTNHYEVTVDTTLHQDGTYFITAEIFDLAGRSILLAAARFNIDNHVPDLNINSPGEMEYVEGDVEINAEVHDHFTSLTECDYNVDNKGWVSLDRDPQNSTGTYDVFRGVWDTSKIADGVHSVDIRGSDRAGFERSYTISVVVDNHAPTCEIHTPIRNQYVEGTLTFRVKAGDKVGMERVLLSFRGEMINASYNSQSGYYEYGFDTTTVDEDGAGTVFATAYDLSGKSVRTENVRFNIDNTPPELRINAPDNLDFVNGTILVNATTTDAYPLPTEYNVDSSGWRDVGFPWDTTQINDGTHTVTIRAKDAIGHETTETIRVIVDNDPPTCTVHTPTPSQFAEKSVTIKVLASDDLGIDKVVLNIFTGSRYEKRVEGTFNSVTNYYEYTQSLYGIEDGTYSMNAEVLDLSSKSVFTDPVEFHVDQNFPVLKIRKPVNGEHLSGMSRFNLSWEDRFDARVEYNIDQGGWETYGEGGGNTWDTAQYKDGAHGIKIRATDEAGHVTERTITVFVDNTAPVIKFVSPGRDDHLTGTNTVKVYSYDSVSLENTFVVIDNGTPEEVFINQVTGLFEAPLDTAAYEDGPHSITVTSRDRVGNSNSATLQVRFKNDAPGIITSSLPEKGEGDIEFRINNSYNASKMYISIDGGGWSEMSHSSSDDTFWYIWNTELADNGKHSYRIKAVDEYGNEQVLSDVIEVKNEESFVKEFTDILPLILFIMLIVFIIVAVFLLIRSGKAGQWLSKSEGEEEEEGQEAADDEIEGKKGRERKENNKGMSEERTGEISIEDTVVVGEYEDEEGVGEGGWIEVEEFDEDEPEYECPDCGTPVGEDAETCPGCGVEFLEDDGYEDEDEDEDEVEDAGGYTRPPSSGKRAARYSGYTGLEFKRPRYYVGGSEGSRYGRSGEGGWIEDDDEVVEDEYEKAEYEEGGERYEDGYGDGYRDEYGPEVREEGYGDEYDRMKGDDISADEGGYGDENEDGYGDGYGDGNEDGYGDGNEDEYGDGNEDEYGDGNEDEYGDGNEDEYGDGNEDEYGDGYDRAESDEDEYEDEYDRSEAFDEADDWIGD